MYSGYTTQHTVHTIQFMCILYNLYCIVRIDYTDNQLIFDIILHYMYRMCVKISVLYVQSTLQCTVYILHIYAHCAISPLFTLKLCIYPRRTNAFCAH